MIDGGMKIDATNARKVQPSSGNNFLRSQEHIQTDQHPSFQQHKPDLERMQGYVSENSGADCIEDVVKRRPRIHPSHPVSAVSQKNHQRRQQRRDLPCHCDVHGFYYAVYCREAPGRSWERISLTAAWSGPLTAQPLAHSWPPPPKRSASLATFTFPLLRRLTRKRPSGSSRKNTATSASAMDNA